MAVNETLLDALIRHGLYVPMGVDGLYGRSAAFEAVVAGVDALATRLGDDQQAEVLRFPPVLNRRHFERSDYLRSFPHLTGAISSFTGDESGHEELLRTLDVGGDWTTALTATDLVMAPAACYAVYPVAAARGRVPARGWMFDVSSTCFRREPSLDPARLQLFRMREYVCLGTPAQATGFRDRWMERGADFATRLHLPYTIAVANDPFFGRAGRMLSSSQRDQKLKYELLVPVHYDAPPTACLSFNDHHDHFGQIWDMRGADGAVAHSACVGFGLERLTLALLVHHGFLPDAWPQPVRHALWG
jgi:seryl-tRNA synthetase